MTGKEKIVHKVTELLREQSTLAVLYHSHIAEKLGLNPTDHKALDLLIRSGKMTAGQLSKASRLTTGAITGVIDRLEKAGYVTRDFDAADRRKVLIRVIPETQEKLLPVFAPIMKETQKILKDFSEKELEVVARFIGRCNDAVKSM